MAANYQDVLDQLCSAGLHVESLEIGRMVRCRVEGDREKRGWYMLHDLQTSSGEQLIVGSFGVWHGNDNGAQKIALRKTDVLTLDQHAALRKRLAEDRKRAERARQHEGQRAASRAASAWERYAPIGESDYLARKGVTGHGLRFTAGGSAVVPLLDVSGSIRGLQFLRTAAQAKQAKRPTKEFWPAGVIKKAHFHLIGSPQHLLLIAEGYATGASLHEATGYPVAIAFDAGNLGPVAAALHARYPAARILICADDDAFTDGNPGITAASTAALAVGGAWLAPKFADDEARHAKHAANGHKITDFNDLHALEGLHVVRKQAEARLTELQWRAPAAPVQPPQGAGGDRRLKPITSADELLRRFPLVYGHSGAVFDRDEHILMSLSDMRDACVRRDIHRSWAENPARDIVRIREVGFDPGCDDESITCNLFGGWPTTPQAGNCDRLLELLRYMCSGEKNHERLYQWVLRWIAYPIQHPGAKMKSTLVIHGPQGTGKNLFFEALMSIYGEYGDVIDQSAIEDKFNDWASRKLFLIADEVVARADLYHSKNKIKGLITGDRIRINPKNFAAYWERNHVNLVFLSNETMPAVLEEDDRRHCVIWTPPKQSPDYYASLLAEIRNGGVAALHDYLLHLDLAGFDNGAHPPASAAKNTLIDQALDSTVRFLDEVYLGEVPGIKPAPGRSTDWYEIYRLWCSRSGHRAAPLPKFVNAIELKRDIGCQRERYLIGQTTHGPHGILNVGNLAVPDGESRQVWLGDCIGELRGQLRDYRGTA